MPPSEPSRVFISYARKDGAALAQRLQSDLEKEGFDAWLDTRRIAGGAVWTTDIEVALDKASYVLALLTQGSYVSEICRSEQLRALRKGTCVIPLSSRRCLGASGLLNPGLNPVRSAGSLETYA